MSCPPNAVEYKLNNVFFGPSKNNTNSWMYIQTMEDKCGTFELSVWYKEPKLNNSVIILPNCTIELYRRLPSLIYTSSKMKLIEKYDIEWNTKDRFMFEGSGGYFKGVVLINLKFEHNYNNGNYYYIRFVTKNFPSSIFYHEIKGNQDETEMYQVALWMRETPRNYYPYIVNSIDYEGVIDQVIFLDRTLVGSFKSSLDAILNKMAKEKSKFKIPITKKDIIVTTISSLISEVGNLDLMSGITISLFITAVANCDEIIENPEGDFMTQINKLLGDPLWSDSNFEIAVNEKDGSTYFMSKVGLKIILRTKYVNDAHTYADLNSVEIWEPGALGKEYIKLVKGPLFYKGQFYKDSELFVDGFPVISNEVLANVFGWTEYFELAKKQNQLNNTDIK